MQDVQLETRPSDPYSVNVWGVGHGAQFLIASGGGAEGTWALHILEDPRVRLRIDGNIYELNAVLSEEESVRSAFLAAAKKKYDFEPDADESAKAALFVLSPR